MIQRLHVRIYLTTLASLAVVVILCALLWRFTAERSADAEHDRFSATLIGKALPSDAPPRELQASLAQLVVPPIRGLALFDRNGVRLAAAGNARKLDHLAVARAGQLMSTSRAIALADGRVVVMRVQSESLEVHLGGLVLITLIALAVALGTYPIVRRMTRRLESVARTVDRFGHGDLAIRVPVSGTDEVSRLASAFNDMADRVASLLDAHGRMLANASHELRSPLTRIRMALELHATNPRPELLNAMRTDCAEIDDQIEEILLASKLDTVDTELIGGIVDLEVLLAEESSRLDIPFDTVAADVRGDARLLRRMLRNLLENAVKHGGKDVGARIAIGVNGDRIVHVSDRGPGIPAHESERIFEPFYRPAHTSENGSGWGLGLALVRQIADHHRGRVRCLPREGGGCVFELTLPDPRNMP